MWPGMRPATGWMPKRTFDAVLAQRLGDLVDRVLRLRDRHAVARHDDHVLRLRQQLGGLGRGDRRHLAGGLPRRPASPARRCSVPKPPAITREEVAVHRAAHDVREDRAARADQRAGDDQQVVGQHEAGRRRGPARVAVQHRHDDRHVGAADRHHHVHAEEQRDDGHHDQRQSSPATTSCASTKRAAEPDHERAAPTRLSQWRAGSSSGLPPIFADSLPNAITEPGERDRADQHAEVDLDLVDRRFLGASASRRPPGRCSSRSRRARRRGRRGCACSATSSGICVICTVRATRRGRWPRRPPARRRRTAGRPA